MDHSYHLLPMAIGMAREADAAKQYEQYEQQQRGAEEVSRWSMLAEDGTFIPIDPNFPLFSKTLY